MWKTWLKGLGTAVAGGALVNVMDALQHGGSLTQLKGVTLAGALVGLTAYLKQSPLSPAPGLPPADQQHLQ